MKQLLLTISLLALASLLTACGGLAGEPEIVGQMPTATPMSIPNSVPDMALGALVFSENCVRCHGATGAGDGEFVQSGQITDIPNFTDPNFHQGRTAAEYYTAVTQGRLEKLMPPFADGLSDEERWSVANYVFTLAGASAPLPETTESAVTTNPEATAESTAEAPTSVVGTISGHITNGSASGTIPVGSTVTLRVVEMQGTESTFTATVNDDGSYQFPNVPISESSAYRASIEYLGGTFSSEFTVGTPTNPNMTLDVRVYETTDNPNVLQINMVLTQIDLIGENTLQVWQMINVTNVSDMLYVSQDDSGRSVSVRVPVPQGFTLSSANDLNRFSYDSTNGYIYDTRPVVPQVEHTFHLIYTVPFNGSLTVNQLFDYEFFGPYEAYVDSSKLSISGSGWQNTGSQSVNGITYQGIAMSDGSATGLNLQYQINSTAFPISRNMIGYALMALGFVFILGALFVYWRGRNQPQTVPAAAVPSDDPSQPILQAIVALDEKFEGKQISKKAYEKEREKLRAQLKAIMKDKK